MKLTDKDRAMLLQKFDDGIIKIGQRIPMMEMPIRLALEKEMPTPEFHEIEITEKLIAECRYMFNSFIVTFYDRVECAKIPNMDDIDFDVERYDEYKKHAEEQAVMDIYRKGCILLKFEWGHDEFITGNVLYATIGKVTIK